MAFDILLAVRANKELKARYTRLARQPEHRGRDESDLMRMAMEDYCHVEEQKLKMQPITPEEVEQMLAILAAERAGAPDTRIKPSPALAPPKPTGPVSYRTAKAKDRRRN